jgi:hypothetical protein
MGACFWGTPQSTRGGQFCPPRERHVFVAVCGNGIVAVCGDG